MDKTITITDIFTPLQYSQTYEFDDYISDRKAEIISMLTDKECYYFIAETYSGKTFSILNIAHEEKIKLVFAVPLRIIALQKHEEFRDDHHIHIPILMGEDINNPLPFESSAEAIMNGPETNVIVSVYDSVRTLLDNEHFTANEYVLVIDECHNLVTQNNFRSSAINSIEEYKGKFKKVIYLTGTIEGTNVYRA